MDTVSTFNGWKRNKEVILSKMQTRGEQVLAKSELKVLCPMRWMEGHLGTIEEDVRLVGFFLITDGTHYAVSRCCASVVLSPQHFNTVTVDDVKYYEFGFDKSSVMIKNTQVVKLGTMVFRIYEEFFSKGYIPPYFSLNDVNNIFLSAEKYGGVKFPVDYAIAEMIASALPKSLKSSFVHRRNDATGREDMNYGEANYIGINNVAYGATNTISKLLGNYPNESITSALAHPSERLESIDKHLRS